MEAVTSSSSHRSSKKVNGLRVFMAVSHSPTLPELGVSNWLLALDLFRRDSKPVLVCPLVWMLESGSGFPI
jgi:hypothetical protein